MKQKQNEAIKLLSYYYFLMVEKQIIYIWRLLTKIQINFFLFPGQGTGFTNGDFGGGIIVTGAGSADSPGFNGATQSSTGDGLIFNWWEKL